MADRLSPNFECNATRPTQLRLEIRQARRQLRAGHYIRDVDVTAWLLSWGTDHELPPPKCACGEDHDDEALCR